MIKMMMLLFSVIANNFFSTVDEVEILVTPNEEYIIEGELIDIVDGYYVYYFNEKYFININDCVLCFDNYDNLIEYKEQIYITSVNDNKLFIYVYNTKGELIEKSEVENFNVLKKHKMIVLKDELYIVGTSYNESDSNREDLLLKNIFIYNVTNKSVNYFGGEQNEVFLDVNVKNSFLYLSIAKDKLTYGDFGNGGLNDVNLSLVKIDENLMVMKVLTLNVKPNGNEKIYIRDSIYIDTENLIIRCDYDLLYLNSTNYSKGERIYVGYNFIVVFGDQIKLLYHDTLEMYKNLNLKSFDLTNVKIYIFDKIVIKEDAFYDFDVIDFRRYKKSDKYYDDVDLYNNLKSLYGNVDIINKEYDSYFSKSIFGSYKLEITYKNMLDVYFVVENKEEVDLVVNIENDMVYPLGYRLTFNGDAYLDGKVIVNNYPVSTTGKHKLQLYGKSEVIDLEFEVSESNLEYNDIIYQNYDFKTLVNKPLELTLKFNREINDIEISDIISNYEVLETTLIDNNVKIKFNGFSSVGKYILYIERVLYLFEGVEYEYIVNEIFEIVVIYPEKTINVSEISEDFSITIDAIDKNKTLRGIYIECSNNNQEHNCYYILGNFKNIIELDSGNFNNIEFSIKIYLVYYNVINYEYVELLNMNYLNDGENIILGKMNHQSFENYEQITLSFEKDFISKCKMLNYNNKNILENERIGVVPLIVMCIFLSAFGLLIGYFFKYKYLKK